MKFVKVKFLLVSCDNVFHIRLLTLSHSPPNFHFNNEMMQYNCTIKELAKYWGANTLLTFSILQTMRLCENVTDCQCYKAAIPYITWSAEVHEHATQMLATFYSSVYRLIYVIYIVYIHQWHWTP